MSVELTSPTTLTELAHLSGLVTPVDWHVLRDMWRKSRTFTFRAGGEVIGLAGLTPIETGGREAYFKFTPMAAKHLHGIIRHTRLTLSDPAYSGTVTLCVTEEGKRFAALCGFFFVAQSPIGEVWAHDNGSTLWHQRAVEFGNRAGSFAADRAAAGSLPATGTD